MAGNSEVPAGPSYISSSYADNILSDIRPIRLKLEALRSVNVLLDEFLYNILKAAGSLHTDSIKAGLNKVLPTALGKEAVLEAEMELKAYWDRNSPYEREKDEFDLQWSFELLRLKCEGYTTMNDGDEDADAIKRVNDKMSIATGLPVPHTSVMAPASLYLTAILEHVCQHVLSNVGLVIARDSSRTVATVQDLLNALCEDASLYSTFKSMNVYTQIESLAKMQHPRRSKSLSKSSANGRSSPGSRAASPIRDLSSSRLRVSSESSRPILLSQQPASGSNEKSRVRLFGRSSSDHERTELPDPRLAIDDAQNGNFSEVMVYPDDSALQEFDELMKSSTTMKVSLTPDRLKSMEVCNVTLVQSPITTRFQVYKQERKRHKVQEHDPAQISPEPTRSDLVRRPVDSIREDDEPNTNTMTTTAPSAPSTGTSVLHINNMLQNVITPRSRLASLASSPMSNPTPPGRTRSITISTPLSKKRSIGQMRPPPIPASNTFPPRRGGGTENVPTMQNGKPPRTRKVIRNRESMDLDEVMGVGDDEMGNEPMTPRRREPSRYISQSARDLIDFLDEGPPEELRPPTMHANASMLSFDSSKTSKSGRLQRMMSKLALGGSDRSNSRTTTFADEFGRSSHMNRRSPSSSSLASSTPPSAYALSMTPKKTMPAVIVATPPPPVTSFNTASSVDSNSPPSVPQSSPPSYASTLVNSNPNASPNGPNATRPVQRRVSITRKAVPNWDSEEQVIIMPPATPKSEKHRSRPSPLDAFPPVPETVNLDGRILPNGHVEVIAEMRARRESRTPSPLDSASQFRRSSLIPDSPPSLHSQSAPTTPTPPRPTHSPPPLPDSPSASQAQDLEQAEEVGVLAYDSHVDRRVEAGTQTAALDDAVEIGPEDIHNGKADISPRTFTASDAQDLRRLLSVATTAAECRLLVDMFMAQCGLAAPVEEACEPSSTAAVEAAATELKEFNEDLERSLVSLLLGEDVQADERIPCTPPFLQPTPSPVYLSA
ncbi:hypothetical protein EIP86_000398 [Pleurotus ostreatoroseus]|nr:hypothetical protein EIP86_000398 [Pleurotus ostreatoroseus]